MEKDIDVEHMENIVVQAEQLIQSIIDMKIADRKNRAPYYLDLLGASYAMALSYAQSEGYREEDILEHLAIFNQSAKMSLEFNKKSPSNVTH
jgi:hypothetical protein